MADNGTVFTTPEETEWLAEALEGLAAKIRRHGYVDGEFGIHSESKDLEPEVINGLKYRNQVPTGRDTYRLSVMVDSGEPEWLRDMSQGNAA